MAITSIYLDNKKKSYPIGANITTIPQLYEGRELNYTWKQLEEKVKKADYSDLLIGDYKIFSLQGDTNKLTARIAGIDTYYGTRVYYTSGTTRFILNHHIDFICDELLDTFKSEWDDNNSNNGDGSYKQPYANSQLFHFLTDKVKMLPSDLQSVIGRKTILLETRYSAAGSLNSANGAEWADIGKLWIPTEYEVFGYISKGTNPYSAGLMIQYPLFINNTKYRLKKSLDDNQYHDWWLNTTCSGNTTQSCSVSVQGRPDSLPVQWKAYAPICFTISDWVLSDK